MINCIIVDEDKTDRKTVENTVSQIKHLHLIKSFSSLTDARETLLAQPIDILFLQMPSKVNGFAVLDELSPVKPKIIVTSHSSEAAQQAFDIDAVDFLLKPVTVPRVVKALARALKIKDRDEKEVTRGTKSIFLKVKKQFVKVPLRDIYLIEALADYVNIYTTAKRYTIHSTMKAMEEELPKGEFIRVHKSFIVRVDRIAELKDEKLVVEGKSIPIGNSYRKELLRTLDIL